MLQKLIWRRVSAGVAPVVAALAVTSTFVAPAAQSVALASNRAKHPQLLGREMRVSSCTLRRSSLPRGEDSLQTLRRLPYRRAAQSIARGLSDRLDSWK